MDTIVAIDLETTGLDPERDAVIEIGAVRFQGTRIQDEFQQLVNPGRPLDRFIVELTGINDAMLAGAPRITQVLEPLREFVGDYPILGHNVRFDLSFMQRKGLFLDNLALDTYDMASVLIPAAARYRLDALASALGVISGEHHRALSDAQTTHQIYLRLREIGQSLPYSLVDEIVNLGSHIDWGAGYLFEDILDEWEESGHPTPHPKPEMRKEPIPARAELVPQDDIQPLDEEDLAAILEPGGAFADALDGYEFRSQQVTMLRSVANALSNSKHLLVEAGTGTGKSLAYLIPALHWAAQNGRRVVVSTNTINLQDQLLQKDIPSINQALGTNYTASVLKGRGNYLCPRRLSAMRRLGVNSSAEIRLLTKILVWLVQGGSGDRSEINLGAREEGMLWSRISADSEECAPDVCQAFSDGKCPYYYAQELAKSSHVLIVNHALLLADIATGSRVIPEYDYLIVDEAHHLESATTNGLSYKVTEREFGRLLNELGARSRGLLQQVLAFVRARLSPKDAAQAQDAIQSAIEKARECETQTGEFFQSLNDFMASRREDRPISRYGQSERIIPSSRTLPGWTDVEVSWENLREPLTTIIHSTLDTADALADLISQEKGDDLLLSLRTTARDLNALQEQLDEFIFEPASKVIYWIECSASQEQLSLHAAPLEVGHLVEEHLWHAKESIIMTSATLTTHGSFDYLRQRLSALDAEELCLGSPFDFETSTLLYLLDNIPEPSDRHGYQRAVKSGLLALCKATQGRALVLFTSYQHLKQTARALTEPLAREGILVFEQGEGASRHALVESFRSTEKAVLLGTRSFWEGVDVPGDALSVLAILRLPFDVPNDPIVAARAETYEYPFDEFMVPEAILRFRQGFGRLIRTRSDRGIVVIFDHRILSKRYGHAFVESLPQCTLQVGPLQELPQAASRWLGI